MAVDDGRGCEALLGMSRHLGCDAEFGIFVGYSHGDALAEVVDGGAGRHLLYVVADDEHSEASILHRGVEAQGCFACATIYYGCKVGCYHHAVFAVGSCMLATNKAFLYVHNVHFFDKANLLCAIYFEVEFGAEAFF